MHSSFRAVATTTMAQGADTCSIVSGRGSRGRGGAD